MSRLKIRDWVDRRITPASITVSLLLGYACWGTYCVVHELNWGPEGEPGPSASPTPPPWLEQLKQAGTNVQRDFASGAFRQGDPVERVLTARPPTLVIRHPPYTTLYYRDRLGESDDPAREVEVVARDGRLVQAETRIGTGPREYRVVRFFGDGGLMFTAAYTDTLIAGIERWRADAATALMAVIGAAAVSR